MTRWVIGVLAMLVLAPSATWIQRNEIHPRADTRFNEDLLYLPNDKLLTRFTGGLSGVFADLLWVQTMNYASREFQSEGKKFTWLDQMIRTVTRLDPYYEDAYVNGGMLMSALGQDDRSLKLLQTGIVKLPDSADIPRELVSIYLLNRRKEPGAPAMTLHYMTLLARNSDHPQFYVEWMDRIRAKNSLEGEARHVWENLLDATNDQFVRDLARSQLAALDAETVRDTLNRAAGAFESARGRPAGSIDELIAFLGPKAPNLADAQGTFYLTPKEVRNTMLDSRLADRSKRRLLGQIKAYHDKNGAYPGSLDVLKDADPGAQIENPVPGHEWQYDAATGDLTDVPAADG